MTEPQYEAISRVQAWVRDFGHTKEPAFIRDIETLLEIIVPTNDSPASGGLTPDGR